MGTKEAITALFHKLIDESITAEELNLFYTYVKLLKTNPEIQQLFAELWGYVELTNYTGPDCTKESDFDKLRRNIRLLDLIIGSHVEDLEPDEIDGIIEKIAKGFYH